MPRQGQMVPGANALDYEVVYYEGTDTLKTGYALCYNYDSGTAATATKDRFSRVEKPTTRNLQYFAGIVAEGLPSAGKVGPSLIRIVKPSGVSCTAFTDQSCVIGSTVLYIQTASYYLTDAAYTSSTASRPVAIALQTIDRSSTAGTVQVKLDDHILPHVAWGLYSSTDANMYAVSASGVTSGTLYGQFTSLISDTVGGTFVGGVWRAGVIGAGGGFGDGVSGGGAWRFIGGIDCLTAANSNALHAGLLFKTGATNTGTKFSAFSCKVENIDSTPAALASAYIYAAEFVLQMNEDPGYIYMMNFRDDGTTNCTAWFKAESAAAIKFVTCTNATADHAITIDVAGTTYYIGCYDALTGA